MKQLPPPDDEKEFEKIIRDICRALYCEPGSQLYGRKGQSQSGIDGYFIVGDEAVSYQCKKKDILNTPTDKLRYMLLTEMEKESSQARQFFNNLGVKATKYIFATTFKNDTHLQNKATELSSLLDFPVIYWSWDTISEFIQSDINVRCKYYPEIYPDYRFNANRYIKHITKEVINENIFKEEKELRELAYNYLTINDNEEVVFKVICNNIDVRNNEIIDKAARLIFNSKRNSAIWLTGDGGTGKTSILVRLAVEFADNGKKAFLLDFENPLLNEHILYDSFSYLKDKAGEDRLYIFIDNPCKNINLLQAILRDISNHRFEFILVFTERTFRFDMLERDNLLRFPYGQDMPEQLLIKNPISHREEVYKRFYEIIGTRDNKIWQIINEIGIKTDLAFVNATYKILLELTINKLIHFVFDWEEYALTAKDKFPSLKGAYKYIAVLYLFGINTPFSILKKLFSPTSHEISYFLTTFSRKGKEPLILLTFEHGDFNYKYYLRTKHEIISSIFFETSELDKNDLIADIIREFDPNNSDEVNILIQLFGNKKNIREGHLNYDKLSNFLLSGSNLNKLKQCLVLYRTIYLTKHWIELKKGQYKSAIDHLKEALLKFPHDLHSRTELSRIYQQQKRFKEAEKVLLELLEIDNNNLQARTELSRIYQQQKRFKEAEKVLLECMDIDS
ncbi:MAG: tetratricopeptide repeat protein, partial [Candidatus Zixiibacteriota bacterium]